MLFSTFFYELPELLNMLFMRFSWLIWRRSFHFTTLTSSNSSILLDIIISSFMRSPSTFNKFVQILLHIVQLIFYFHSFFSWCWSLLFLIISCFLQRLYKKEKYHNSWTRRYMRRWSLFFCDKFWDRFTFPSFKCSMSSSLNLNNSISGCFL